MSSSKRKQRSSDKLQSELSAFPDDVQIEIAPGVRLPFSKLRKEEGRQEAESLRRAWLRSNRNPMDYVKPETLKINKRMRGYTQVFFALDVQMLLCGVAKHISKATSYTLGLNDHPDAPSVITERVREILYDVVNREMNNFIIQLVEDITFETLLSLDGKIRFRDDRTELKKEWYRRAASRFEKKRRKIFQRDGQFPTLYLLREAILEAIEAIRREDPHKKITQPLVVEYFSKTEKYTGCGDESSLRRWLRKHRVESWECLVKELLQEHRARSFRKCKH
jgi:hypothetical protein